MGTSVKVQEAGARYDLDHFAASSVGLLEMKVQENVHKQTRSTRVNFYLFIVLLNKNTLQ